MSTPLPCDVPALADALSDRYRIERTLGAGGMATVYLATDLKHDRRVAVKVLRERDTPVDVERFHREVRVLARLRHPFILPLHDSGEAAGALYFIMPYIDGESLRARIERETRLPVSDALEITRQVADALYGAHVEGVIHRDVKPENILIARTGHALLADFGIARGTGSAAPANTMTQTGLAIGTAAYMSPEQAMGERTIDERSDVYSLACVLFEMLAGRPPFTGSAVAVVAQHLTASPADLSSTFADVPRHVAQAVARALAKAPEDRFSSARAFAAALDTTGGVPAYASKTGVVEPGPRLAARLSIAVLPIANIGGDPETEYFADGLSEELTGALSKLEGLRVVSRTSASAFRGQALPLAEIASRLGVEFVVEASVRRAGARLRLTAKLIRASEDAPLWAETFDRTLDDVFAVQDEITARIVDTITHALQLGGLRGQVPVAKTQNLRAYDLYLLGRHHWYKRSEASMRRARELFEEAIALDPEYAPVYSGLADASALLASWQFAEPAEMFPVAAAAARRALELDPTSADAHASLGFVKYNWEWDWAGAVRELRRAIELNPNHETAHRWLSGFLGGIGHTEEALVIADRAILLDPLSPLPRMNVGIIKLLGGRWDEAAEEFQRVLEIQPGFLRVSIFLGCCRSLQGYHDEACEMLRDAAVRSNSHPVFLCTQVYGLTAAGRMDEARAVFEPLRESSKVPLYRAMALHTLGDNESAYVALEQAIAERVDWLYTLGTLPWIRGLRGEPRFRELLVRLRLIDPLSAGD